VPSGQSTVIVGGGGRGGGGSGGVALAGHVVMHVPGPQSCLPSTSGQSHSPTWHKGRPVGLFDGPEQGGIRVGVHVVTGGGGGGGGPISTVLQSTFLSPCGKLLRSWPAGVLRLSEGLARLEAAGCP
jgi:hypothetical protein